MQQTNFTPLTTFLFASWQSKVHSYLQRLTTVAVLLVAVGISQQTLAQVFTSTSLTIAASPTGASTTSTTYYGARPTNSTPKFNGAQLSTAANPIDPFSANGTLNITLVADAINPRGTAVTSSRFYYRVYPQGTSAASVPAYSSVNMTLTSSSNQANPTTYAYNTPIDLLTVPRSNGGGTYVVDIYYDESDEDDTDPNDIIYHTGTDPNNGQSNPYSATFVVAAPATTPAGATTTWQSTSSTAWFTASNWSNGVPTATSDAIIPENTAGTNIVFPVLNNPARNYRVRNLTLNGTTNSGRAQLTIQQAVLHVYGNIQQLSGGLVGTNTGNQGVLDSTANSTLMLRGANQFMTGRLSVPDIIISGTDIKSVANTLLPTNIIAFLPTTTSGVIVQSASAQQNQNGTTTYVFDTTGNSLINLGSTGAISSALVGKETNVSYIKGIVTSAQSLMSGNTQTFGNIGLDFTPNHSTALVTVQRIIGDPLLGPTTPAPGVTPVPIKRQFSIVGDDNSGSAATAGSSNDIVFHYLDSTYELNTIMESNLALFRTLTGSAPYTAQGGVLDQVNNTVTRLALPSLPNYYLTLGDRTNPLPVSLVAFAAVRNNGNTLLSWTTATEENNKGFNVQVSKDGANFRTISFVASKLVNSVQVLNYTYTDTETGKAGTRYYRLEQVDNDGKVSYSPVRAVSFDGNAATSVALVAYPNPFTDTVGLTLEGLTAADGAVAYVKIVDMTGHTVRDQKLSLIGASLSLGNLSDLRSGLYLAKVTLPDGSTKTVRIQRQ